MPQIVLLNKPFDVLCQFTDLSSDSPRNNLSHYLSLPGYYPAGRLDRDSEGLLILTNDGRLQDRIASPEHKLPKTYWAQVEGIPDDKALAKLCQGVLLKDGLTAPAKAERLAPSALASMLWPRDPPIRQRQHQPTAWIALTLTEGRNRQVRRMTAAVGHPTLRLIRVQIGPWHLGALQPGEHRLETVHLPQSATTQTQRPAATQTAPGQRASRRRPS